MAENKAHLALLGLGAMGMLYWLYTHRSAAQPSPSTDIQSAPDNSGTANSYPNSAPIQLGNITIGGSPTYLQMNQLPVTADGTNPNLLVPAIVNPGGENGGGCCDQCDNPPGQIVAQNVIAAPVFAAAVGNIASSPAVQVYGGGGGGGATFSTGGGGYGGGEENFG